VVASELQTTQEILEWLVSNEKELQAQGAFSDGFSLTQVAARLGFIASESGSFDRFAREIARLQEDGAIRWNYSTYPNDPRPEPPAAEWFASDYFQRCRDIRLTVAGRQGAREAVALQIRDSVIGQIALRDINTINLVTLFDLLEAHIGSTAAPESTKAEARKLLERMKDMAGGVASGTTTALISEALKKILGL
jgi:hypothetical protein